MGTETTLKLTLSCKWYDMIESGIKKEEYRDITPYWISRICRKNDKHLTKEEKTTLFNILHETGALGFVAAIISCGITFYNHKTVTFYRGVPYFSDKAKHMTWSIESMGIGIGNIDWGAPQNKHVIKLTLGKRIL
ncbi:hypothetical protein [Bacteroides ihuae]|uniref:hypothetical protein n=1 Tax=Bacteroides ihuae TaxID=1852362 RepID=UPI0008D9984C|nr:hypothetical protein [Bacteroides ihuae]